MENQNLCSNSNKLKENFFSNDVPQEEFNCCKDKSLLKSPRTLSNSLYKQYPCAIPKSHNSELDETLPCRSLRASQLSFQKTKSDLNEIKQLRSSHNLSSNSVRTFSSKSGRRVSLLSVSTKSYNSDKDEMETAFNSELSSDSSSLDVNESVSDDAPKISVKSKSSSKIEKLRKQKLDAIDSDIPSYLEDSISFYVNKSMSNDVLKISPKSKSSSEIELTNSVITDKLHKQESDAIDSDISSYLEDSNAFNVNKSMSNGGLKTSSKSKSSLEIELTNSVITDKLRKQESDSTDSDISSCLEDSTSSYVNKSMSNGVLKISPKSQSSSEIELTHPIATDKLRKQESGATDSDKSKYLEDSHKSVSKYVLKISSTPKESSKNKPTYPFIPNNLHKKRSDPTDSYISSYLKDSNSSYNHKSVSKDVLKISPKSKSSCKNKPAHSFTASDLGMQGPDPINDVKIVESALNHSNSMYNCAGTKCKTLQKLKSCAGLEEGQVVPLDSIVTMTPMECDDFSDTALNHFDSTYSCNNMKYKTQHKLKMCPVLEDCKDVPLDSISAMTQNKLHNFAEHKVKKRSYKLRTKNKVDNINEIGIPDPIFSSTPNNHYSTKQHCFEYKTRPILKYKENNSYCLDDVESCSAKNNSVRVCHSNSIISNISTSSELNGLKKDTQGKKPSAGSEDIIPMTFKEDFAPPLFSSNHELSSKSIKSDSYVNKLPTSLDYDNSTNEVSRVKVSRCKAEQCKLKECYVDLTKNNFFYINDGFEMPLILSKYHRISPKVLKNSTKSFSKIEKYSTDSFKFQTTFSAINLSSNNKPCEVDHSYEQQKKKRRINSSEFVEVQKLKEIHLNKPTMQQLDAQPRKNAISQKLSLSKQRLSSKVNKDHSTNTSSNNHLKTVTSSHDSSDNLKNKLNWNGVTVKVKKLVMDSHIRNTEKIQNTNYNSDRKIILDSSKDKYKTLAKVTETSEEVNDDPKNKQWNEIINKSTLCVLSSSPKNIFSKLTNTKKMSPSVAKNSKSLTKNHNKRDKIKKHFPNKKNIAADFGNSSSPFAIDVLSSPILNKWNYGF